MRTRLAFPVPREEARPPALPFTVWAVLASTGVAVFTSGLTVFGLPLNALAWILPLFAALVDLAVIPGRPRLPLWIWVPWLGLLLVYVLGAETENAFQRTVMMAAPLAVGLAVSKYAVGAASFARFERGYRVVMLVLLAGAALKSGLSLGRLPDSTPLAAEVMTGSLLASLYAVRYASGQPRSLLWWCILALVPVVALTRTGIIATALTLPLTLAPLPWRRRALFVSVVALATVAVFHTDRVQRKMFITGHGELTDLTTDNPNLFMSGRKRVWEYLEWEVSLRPWFGHGANASEPVVRSLTRGATHPHNDWLRLRYEYGNVGALVFGACMLVQLLHLWSRARLLTPERRTLAYAGASSFVIFGVFMLTDNIVLYASFFGHLQFAIIGLAYSADPDAHAAAQQAAPATDASARA